MGLWNVRGATGSVIEGAVVVVGFRCGSWKACLWVWSCLCWASWMTVGAVDVLVLFVVGGIVGRRGCNGGGD